MRAREIIKDTSRQHPILHPVLSHLLPSPTKPLFLIHSFTMSSFTRFAGVAVVLLSLGFLVTAIPIVNDSIPAITGTDAVSLVCAKLFVDIEVKIKALRMSLNSYLHNAIPITNELDHSRLQIDC